jgi:DNA-binding PucR family transcriptional regulator
VADADRLVSRLGGHAIAATEEDLALVVIPDPDAPGRRGELRAALRDDRAALGPTVTLERTARSLARARAALRLLEGGVLPKGATPLVTDDHLPELLLHGDEALAGDLTTRALAPLQELAPGTRTRLATTLRAWLDEPGQVTRIAERLHVHPQTVRYRVAQLRELFGQRLEEPECRFELALALRLAGDDGLR